MATLENIPKKKPIDPAAEIEQLIEVVSSPLSQPIKELSLLRKSLLFAELSYLSYFLPEQIADAARKIGFDDYEFVTRENAQAYVLNTQYDCVVVFRGTEPDDLEDIRSDVDAIMVIAETMGRVHRGFKRESDRLWEPLEKMLSENHKPIWFTGHSLGGAIATICAGRCVLSTIPSNPEGLFTFGSPRVGNRRFINFVKLNHFRWVNNNDLVTRLPPRWLGYSHSGRELYLDANGKIRRYSALRLIRDRWKGFFLTLRGGRFDHLADHLISSYINFIKQAVHEEDVALAKSIPPDLPTPAQSTPAQPIPAPHSLSRSGVEGKGIGSKSAP